MGIPMLESTVSLSPLNPAQNLGLSLLFLSSIERKVRDNNTDVTDAYPSVVLRSCETSLVRACSIGSREFRICCVARKATVNPRIMRSAKCHISWRYVE